MTDFSQTSINDSPMSIFEMLENKANWDYAAELIAAGQIPLSQFDLIAKMFPEFWLIHCIPNGSA